MWAKRKRSEEILSTRELKGLLQGEWNTDIFRKKRRPFGEKKKEKDLVRKELARVRATAMEGSLGIQKEHYNLRRVKAGTKRTEILYIFFDIHTANVVQLADRIEQEARLAAA